MIYSLTPVRYEIYNEDMKELAASVEMFDEGGAVVEIKGVYDRTTFDRLVPLIQQALSAMKLVGDVK